MSYFRLAILASLVIFLIPSRASAQADLLDRLPSTSLMLQLQLNESIKLDSSRLVAKEAEKAQQACKDTQSKKALRGPIDLKFLQQTFKGLPDTKRNQLTATDPEFARKLLEADNKDKIKDIEVNPKFSNRKRLFAQKVYTPDFSRCITAQPMKVTWLFPVNGTYETNALKSPTKIQPDETVGFGGTLLYTNGVEGQPFDLVAFSAGSTSLRYNSLTSKNLDSTIVQGLYQHFLSATGYDVENHTDVPVTPRSPVYVPPAGLITYSVVGFGFQNQTAFTSTFHRETADVFTPQISYAIQNIPLSLGSAKAVCRTTTGSQGFCTYIDFGVSFGHTSSDQASQENYTVAATIAPGWRIDGTDLKLSVPTSVTTHSYDHISNRNDELFQVGPMLTYSPTTLTPADQKPPYTMQMSVAATYNQNFSTIRTSDWHGWVIQPALSINF